MKRLLIDVNSIVPYYVSGKVTGIGRTTLELINALAEIDSVPFEIALYSQNMKGIGGRNTELPFKNKHLYFPHRKAYDQFLSYTPIKEWYTGYDLMHIPHNFEYVHRPEKCIVTIHDAMFFSYPEEFLGHTTARKLYPTLAQKAKAILTCSEASKRDISYFMGIPEDRIHVAHWGVNTNLFRPNLPMNHPEIHRPYFFTVSCSMGRKNTISILRAYEQFLINRPEHDLILVWNNPPADVYVKYTSGKFKEKVHFIKSVTNEALAQLYASATATFFLSKYEGFGLPVLESLACGTPIVTCANSSLTEVGGEAAIYVEPEDVFIISQWMEKLENRSVNLNQLRDMSIRQAKKFTWKACAEKTCEVYKQYL